MELIDWQKEAQEKADEQNRLRVERLSQYFSKVNSALTFRDIEVKVQHSTINAPAWSGGSDVVLNSRLINDLNNGLNVANLRGLNFHELSHILYTPRAGSEIVAWVNDEGYRMAFNALEDSRIETLFTARYPSTVDWFVVTVLTYFANDEETFKTSYPLLRGRKYLPLEVRAKSREVFPQQEKLDEICEVVDSYRQLTFPFDTEVAKPLIKRFHELVSNLPECGSGSGQDETRDWNDLADWEKELLAEAGEKPLDPNKPKTTILNCPMGHGQRPMEDIESSVSSRPQQPKQQKADVARSKQLDKKIQDEATTKPQSQSSPQSAGKGVAEILQGAIQNVMDKESVHQEITNIVRIIRGLPNLSPASITEPLSARYTHVVPDSHTLSASLSFGRELDRLKTKFDPAWDKYESRGRLNAGRFLRGDELDTVFDTWNEGREEATEIECVVILDNSGSMNGDKASNAYRAMYAVKSALDHINAKCSVILFNSTTNMLYKADEKAGNSIRDGGANGGTEAEYAVKYATKLLAQSDKPTKLFFAITDGEWSDSQVCDTEIRTLSECGVLTAFAYIPYHNEFNVELTHEKSHFCDVGAVIHNPFDLVSMARTIVRQAIARQLVAN